jgi:hypothetical protein
MQALGGDWHDKCFACKFCRKEIGEDPFIVSPDNKPVCVKCKGQINRNQGPGSSNNNTNNSSSSSSSGPPCAKCKGPLGSQWVLGCDGSSKLHPQCFSCAACGSPVDPDSGFIKTESKEPLHIGCQDVVSINFALRQLHAPKCGACGQASRGAMITTMERTYHLSCFKCTQCSCTFGVQMGFFIRNGEAMCVGCSGKWKAAGGVERVNAKTGDNSAGKGLDLSSTGYIKNRNMDTGVGRQFTGLGGGQNQPVPEYKEQDDRVNTGGDYWRGFAGTQSGPTGGGRNTAQPAAAAAPAAAAPAAASGGGPTFCKSLSLSLSVSCTNTHTHTRQSTYSYCMNLTTNIPPKNNCYKSKQAASAAPRRRARSSAGNVDTS